MIVIALIIGIFIGCSLSLCIIAAKVVKSNDLGNAKGDFHDFSKNQLHVIIKQDKIKRP
ncbi:MAG: hypothetical protein IJ661_04225 [Lachnospiraceae bacterium]|nr:hypothetical protein [Lachnospiraceae bacterium]